MMKAGIAYSDLITTVSPRYAKEILHPEFGCGLDGFLYVYRQKLTGILNGIDTLLFDPRHDPALPRHYDSSSLQEKRSGKKILFQALGFVEESKPLFIFIGRFTQQKGLHLIIEALPGLLAMQLNIAIIGEGDPMMASRLQEAADSYDNFWLFSGYDESLSHQLYAAADFLLMPSSFEPCGLNQLIALHYGTLPVVHRVGGIWDTVIDFEESGPTQICGKGIAMREYSAGGLVESVRRALKLYDDPDTLEALSKGNMQCDVSFEKSAENYLECYHDILKQ